MKEFDLRHANLASGSVHKHGIVEGLGGRVIGDKRVAERVYYAEEEFYKHLTEAYELEDGLLSPFWIKYGQVEAPLPVLVTSAKLNGVQALLEEDESLRSLAPIDVNDTVWKLTKRDGIDKAINRARPKNGEDIQRLSDFLARHAGWNVYSEGAWGNTQGKLVSASLKVGTLKNLGRSIIENILYNNTHDHGIFDLSFVAEELVERPDYYILSEDVVELSEERYVVRNLTQTKLKPEQASNFVLQVAAHGFHLPEGEFK